MPRKLDLRTGRAVWFTYRAPTVHFDELTRDAKADVLIVGMGISSAMMAEALTAQGRSVICVDRRGPLKGSTPATTALMQFEIDQPLTTLSRMIGKAAARQAWRRSRLAVTNLRGRIDELGINCDLIGRQSLYRAGSTLGPSDLRAEAEARREAGIAAEYLTALELKSRFGIVRDDAILSHNNLALNPRQLTAGLFNKALQRKAKFYSPVEATTFHDTRDEVIVGTKNGPTITAKHVLLATGYELTDIVPNAAHQIISTWAIATRPQLRNLWPSAAFIWEASDPYLYMRSTSDGRIICGGEDEEFSDEETRDKLLAQSNADIGKAIEANAAYRLDAGIFLDWFFWYDDYGSALYRSYSPSPAHFCRNGVWRERHHLLSNCIRGRLGVAREPRRYGCWPIRFQSLNNRHCRLQHRLKNYLRRMQLGRLTLARSSRCQCGPAIGSRHGVLLTMRLFLHDHRTRFVLSSGEPRCIM